MDRNAVLVKTVKGTEEVKARTYGLAARLRSVLIMVDGNSTVSDYAARFGAIPDIEGSLQILLDQGFVEVRAAPVPTPQPSASTAGATAGAAPAVAESRADAIADLRILITDALGPMADQLTMAVDRAKTGGELSAAAERAAQYLENMGARGKSTAGKVRALAQAIAERHFPG